MLPLHFLYTLGKEMARKHANHFQALTYQHLFVSSWDDRQLELGENEISPGDKIARQPKNLKIIAFHLIKEIGEGSSAQEFLTSKNLSD